MVPFLTSFFRFSVQLAVTKQCVASLVKFLKMELWNYFWRKIQNVWNLAEPFLTWKNRLAENMPKTRFWRTCSQCRNSACRKRRWCETTLWRLIWIWWNRRFILTILNQKDFDSDLINEIDISKIQMLRDHVAKRSEKRMEKIEWLNDFNLLGKIDQKVGNFYFAKLLTILGQILVTNKLIIFPLPS